MAAKNLGPTDFARFFEAIWGYGPFPWQQRLIQQLADNADRQEIWPAVLDLPTGSGKTATIDIAVFHLALESLRGNGRRAPMRIAFVVDRRLIVDDAYERATRLARALHDALAARDTAHPVVLAVAEALAALAGVGRFPLVARRLRGGAPMEDDWARTPVQPTVLCSTVDQVGSRLLFRGYGVTDRMKPVHAGLLGADCLLLLDEAHLSVPFRQTLDSVNRLRAPDATPFGYALLTATPGASETSRFGLEAEDAAHPMLAARLAASKPAHLIEVSGKQGVDGETRRTDEVAATAHSMLSSLKVGGIACPVIGVVLNRVARARAVFDRLRKTLEDCDVFLLIGPARSAERDHFAAMLEPIKTGRDSKRSQLERPFIVVATQTIEAGVDLDFDGLVTEAAALDALRQRMGRLNRAGRPIASRAAILAYKTDLAPKADDVVYGDRISATWKVLQQLAAADEVDFGIDAFKGRITVDQLGTLATPVKDSPVLMPAYADLWSQTSPIPNADPDVALFLHGPDRSPASIQIVWRADLADSDLATDDAQDLVERFTLVPPRAGEAVEISLWAARKWLANTDLQQLDLSDAVERETETDETGLPSRRAFRWAGEGSDRTRTVAANELRNGDLIIVPAGHGGCDEWGWNPRSNVPVTDVADLALWPYRSRRFAVRITPELILQGMSRDAAMTNPETGGGNQQAIELEPIANRLAETLSENAGSGSTELLAAVKEFHLPGAMKTALDALEGARGRRLKVAYPYGFDDKERPRGIVFAAAGGLDVSDEDPPVGEPATESDDRSSFADRPIPLIDHSKDVRYWAKSFAVSAGLAEAVAADLALASYLHDAGKADPRLQSYFAGGDPYGPDTGSVLAKSGLRRVPRGAWSRAGLPDNWRHEALSVRLAMLHPDFKQAHDPQLVLWLIGTHHGFGRPLFPHYDQKDGEARPDLLKVFGVDDILEAGAGPQSLAFTFQGMDWAQLFETLKQRYGIWGLARLEAFLRLADHRASEYGSPPPARKAAA